MVRRDRSACRVASISAEDINCDIYPVKQGDRLTFVLASTLDLSGKPDDGTYKPMGDEVKSIRASSRHCRTTAPSTIYIYKRIYLFFPPDSFGLDEVREPPSSRIADTFLPGLFKVVEVRRQLNCPVVAVRRQSETLKSLTNKESTACATRVCLFEPRNSQSQGKMFAFADLVLLLFW